MSELLKKGWEDRIKEIPGDYISVKELSFIIGCSYNKVRLDMTKGLLKFTKRGPEGSKARLVILKENAIEYIEAFHGSDDCTVENDGGLESKPLFPDFIVEKQQL